MWLLKVNDKVLLVLLKCSAAATGDCDHYYFDLASISGIGGTPLVFHFYTHSVFFYLSAAIFTSPHLKWVQADANRRLRAIVACSTVFLLWAGSSAIHYFRLLELAFVKVTAPTKRADKYILQQCMWLKSKTGSRKDSFCTGLCIVLCHT